MVTLAEARTALRERLDERSARQWSDEMLNRWLNEGAKDMARKAEVLQASADIDGVDGTQAYNLPANAVRVHRATWSNDGEDTSYPLEYRDFQSADAVWWTQQAVTQGTPHLFTMWGVPGAVQITLYPTPSVNGTLSLMYYRLPVVATTDSATLDIPMGWEDTVYAYATYMAMMQDRDQRWQSQKALYDEQMSDLLTLTRRYSDQSGSSVQGDYPAVNGWLYEFG